MKMKIAYLLAVAAVSATTGCATSLAPSENFNDWTSPSEPTAYVSKQRGYHNAKATAPTVATGSRSGSL